MKTRFKMACPLIFTAAALVSGLAMADEKPPADAMALSAVVQALESMGYAPITEVSFDDGVWEVEAIKDGQARELRVNPLDAQVISDREDH